MILGDVSMAVSLSRLLQGSEELSGIKLIFNADSRCLGLTEETFFAFESSL